MSIRARADNPAAVLRQRLEALVSQLAELESLRDRVGREENRQRDSRKRGYLRKASELRGQVSGRCNFTDAKLVSAPPGGNTSNYFNECPKANGWLDFNRS